MKKPPSALFVIDIEKERIAVEEGRKARIPIFALVDSNCDPDLVDHVIPGNDDAIRAIRLYLSHAADAVLEARSVLPEVIGGDADDYVEVSETVGTVNVTKDDSADMPDSLVVSEEIVELASDLNEEKAQVKENGKGSDAQTQ